MKNPIKNYREKSKQYLSLHPKTKIFSEYLFSLIVALIAALMFALAYKIFQSPNVPNSLTIISGGTSGLARTIALIFNMTKVTNDTTLIYSIAYAVLNIPLFYLAFRYIGFRFAIFTTINVIATSLITNYINFPFIDELATHIACVVEVPSTTGNGTIFLQAGLLARVFLAGVVNGAASSISFASGASAGGVDTASYYFSMRKSNNIGRYVMLINAIVFVLFATLDAISKVITGIPVYSAIADAILILLFAMIYSFVVSVVIDVITRNNKKDQIQIITKEENLSKLLLANIPHGATIMRAKGAFTGEDRIVIYAIVSTFETKGVVDLVRNADPHSFINVTSVKQVYGRFRKPKVK